MFQTVYKVPNYIITNIKQNIFPNPEEIMKNDTISEYIIKYNVSEKLFFSPKLVSSFIQLYDYKLVKQQEYSLEGIQRFIIYNKQLFKTMN